MFRDREPSHDHPKVLMGKLMAAGVLSMCLLPSCTIESNHQSVEISKHDVATINRLAGTAIDAAKVQLAPGRAGDCSYDAGADVYILRSGNKMPVPDTGASVIKNSSAVYLPKRGALTIDSSIYYEIYTTDPNDRAMIDRDSWYKLTSQVVPNPAISPSNCNIDLLVGTIKPGTLPNTIEAGKKLPDSEYELGSDGRGNYHVFLRKPNLKQGSDHESFSNSLAAMEKIVDHTTAAVS